MTTQHDPMIEKAKSLLDEWGNWLRATPGIHTSSVSRYDERIGDTFVQALPDNEVAERVERILCKIKSDWSKVFMSIYLKYYSGYTNEEIGSSMKVSAATAKQWVKLGEVSVVSYWNAGYGKIDSRESWKKSA